MICKAAALAYAALQLTDVAQVEALLRSESPVAAKLRSYQGKPLPQHERPPSAHSGISGVSELARESEALLGAMESSTAAPLVRE